MGFLFFDVRKLLSFDFEVLMGVFFLKDFWMFLVFEGKNKLLKGVLVCEENFDFVFVNGVLVRWFCIFVFVLIF